jgi:hypothetical protein
MYDGTMRKRSRRMSDEKKTNLKIAEPEAENETPETDAPGGVEISVNTAPLDRHAIREVRSYVDDKGREVNEFVQAFGRDKAPNFYKGRAVVMVRVAGQNVPPRHQSFEFDLDATSVKRAFEMFDDAAEDNLKNMREQQKKTQEAQKRAMEDQSRITVPGGTGKNILGPSGRPLEG